MKASGRWHTLLLTQLNVPPECTRCQAPTERRHEFSAGRTAWMQVLEGIIGLGTSVTVALPFCDACAKASRWRRIKGVAIGTGIGLLSCLLLTVILVSLLPASNHLRYTLPGIVVLAGPVIGFVLGASKAPVELRNYRASNGSVEVRFLNPEVEAKVLAGHPEITK